jgi:uncharacterized protein (DUF488 family)
VLNRRKIILALLCNAGAPIGRKHLFKLAFLLLNKEQPDALGSFYDFLPHKYGAYSFAMNRDLEILVNNAYIIDENNTWAIAGENATAALGFVRKLPQTVRDAVRHLVSSYARMPIANLLRYVYAEFPEYAVRSELKELLPAKAPKPQFAQSTVFTAGYQKLSVDAFFKTLLSAGIKQIIDVRKNPVSRQYGLARKSMSWVAAELDIDYYHFPQLGIPSEKRKDLTDFASYQRLLSWYEEDFLDQNGQTIDQIRQLMLDKPSVLVCLESDVRCCHRGRVAQAIAKQTRLPIKHL